MVHIVNITPPQPHYITMLTLALAQITTVHSLTETLEWLHSEEITVPKVLLGKIKIL